MAFNFDTLEEDLTSEDESQTEDDEEEGGELQAKARRLAHGLGLEVCGASA